jgi:imidazolonepropionase-like amidohydrolase
MIRYCLFLWALALSAQAPLAVKTGHLVDVRQGKVLEGSVLVIRDERVEAVLGPKDALPANARVLDLTAYTVLPGLIDCHTHLVGEIQGASPAAVLEHSREQDLLAGIRHAKTTLHAGFTTVRDMGTLRACVDVALRDAIQDGTVEGPRMQVCGAYLTVSKGAGDMTGLAPDVAVPADMRLGVADSVPAVRQRVRELLNGGADFIKIMATGAVLTRRTKPGVVEFSEDELRAAVQMAAAYGAKIAAHAHGAEGIKNAIRAGVQSIEHASMIDEEGLLLAKQKGTVLSMDIYDCDYIDTVGRKESWPDEFLRKNLETGEAQRRAFKRAHELGVKVVFGTDAGVFPHGLNGRQFAIMVHWGMSPMAALQTATLRAAENLGLEDRVGSLESGHYADLIAVKGDSLTDIRLLEAIPFVMKGGRVIIQPMTPPDGTREQP